MLLSWDSRCRCRFLSAARVSEDTAISLFCALSSLFKLNFVPQDLCHCARCLTKRSTLMSSPKLSGSFFSSLKDFTFSSKDLYGSHSSSVREFKGHRSVSVVCCWHTIHSVQSIMRTGLQSKDAAAETGKIYNLLSEFFLNFILKKIVT